jgi:hypothetical protein
MAPPRSAISKTGILHNRVPAPQRVEKILQMVVTVTVASFWYAGPKRGPAGLQPTLGQIPSQNRTRGSGATQHIRSRV